MTARTAPTASRSLPRACPRCRGHLVHARDRYGGYSSCVCCGFVREWTSGPAIQVPGEEHGRRRRREPSSGKLRI